MIGMPYCSSCGRKLTLRSGPVRRRLKRVEQLYGQLLRAEREAQKEVRETPPEVRSALLEVRPQLDALLSQGGELVVDLHEAAHDRASAVAKDRTRTWEAMAERVLFELLAALDRNANEGG